ncbi:hypothetical protein ADK55_29225 [Streptomyces sp. WM4235]|uniref:hypothetical protein n=1 Tax=Streptomyces sp. WM4235 TaxID=1415551 RepID=UPI0006AFD9E0|nr:hypothetical protein [Streptomyces sp. WM4235]KOU41270.1 hypothetical protein ADK55_29225 [Streptomyces sp. WM4235]
MSTWFANVRIEHRGQYAEYKDRIDVASPYGKKVTEAVVVEGVMDLIVTQRPDMKGGRIVSAKATKLN